MNSEETEQTKYNETNNAFKAALLKTAKSKDVNNAIKLYKKNVGEKLNLPEAGSLNKSIDKCFLSPNFLKADKSRKFLSTVVLYSLFRISEITLAIKQALQVANTEASTTIGDVIVNSWLAANSNEKATIETGLLKDIIDSSILSASPSFAKNCRMFLNAFHSKRRLRNQLSKSMVHLYEPVVFRYLHAANPIVRQNTLMLFVSAFPLQSPKFSSDKNLSLLETQIEEIQSSLSDESPKVRCEAAKSTCRILYEWWDLIPPQPRTEFIKYLSTELCFDGSSSAVRCAVLEGLDFLLQRAESIESIVQYLPNLGYLLHDPVESVRIQFIKLLTTINPFDNINIFKLVHIDHLIYRMKFDTAKCSEAICQLLHPSLFPPPIDKKKEHAINTRRVARCLFLMRKSLSAAEKFYKCLPKYVSVDEILCFLRFAYFWSDKVMKGQNPKLPSVKLVDTDTEMVLPPFEDVDDLEKQELKPECAIWVIISSTMEAVAARVKDSEQLTEMRNRTFPNLNPQMLLTKLNPELHSFLFRFLSLFQPASGEDNMVLEYLQSNDNDAWSDALRCLVKWKTIQTYFPNLVKVISDTVTLNENETNIDELIRSIRFLSFIFAHSELRKIVISQSDIIQELLSSLNKFVPILLLKLNIPFEWNENISILFDNDENSEISPEEEIERISQNSERIANELPGQCLIQIIELSIALRVHLAIQVLQEKNPELFETSIHIIHKSIFELFVPGILSVYNEETLNDEESLPFQVLKTLMTLFADMLSLHVYDGEPFFSILSVYINAIEIENGYGVNVYNLAYECLAKICLSIAVDAPQTKDEVHPAHPIILKMVNEAKTDVSIDIVKHLINSLAKIQLKKKSLPWLIDTLTDVFSNEEERKEEEEDIDDEDEDKSIKSIKSLRNLINETIVKLSNE
ncbi:condensin-2 complex subunit g2 [Histomonas meleagridis]|uniref:condensin-2 complex subunit g2 n=1 Tax=Histomonas meleagridis TaxID=135588 RepID=UPI003559DBD1|nr:condensin-2 complex subunit g2 [Histomonas meleagridis]KAH0801957.1 condensin-2 complex subunit g2 [Histomonas meleagridis]